MLWLAAVLGGAAGFLVILVGAFGLYQRVRWRAAYRRFRATGSCDHRFTRTSDTPFPDVAPPGVWCRICGRAVKES